MDVTNPILQADRLRRWHAGRIIMRQGKLVAVRRRWYAAPASIMRVWWQSRLRPGLDDECTLDYHAGKLGGFMVLDFVRSGPGTQLATFRGACQILDEIARLRESVAIVAHVSTEAISDRLLTRWGWEQHATGMSGRHWIKRFYNGYPAINCERYLIK